MNQNCIAMDDEEVMVSLWKVKQRKNQLTEGYSLKIKVATVNLHFILEFIKDELCLNCKISSLAQHTI